MCVPVLHWSRNTCSADLSVTESAVAEGYGTGYLFFRGELRIGFCTIFAPEIAREAIHRIVDGDTLQCVRVLFRVAESDCVRQ